MQKPWKDIKMVQSKLFERAVAMANVTSGLVSLDLFESSVPRYDPEKKVKVGEAFLWGQGKWHCCGSREISLKNHGPACRRS